MKFIQLISILLGGWYANHCYADDLFNDTGRPSSFQEQISQDAFFGMLQQALLAKYPGPCENLIKQPPEKSISVLVEIETESPITRVEIRCRTGYHFSVAVRITGTGNNATGPASALGGRVHDMTVDYAEGTVASFLKYGLRPSKSTTPLPDDPFLSAVKTWVVEQSPNGCEHLERNLGHGRTRYLDQEYYRYTNRSFRITCPTRSGLMSHEIRLRQYENPSFAIIDSIRVMESVH